MTKPQLSRPVFIVNDLRIETMTYGEYLREYWSDETTSPRGIEPKLHIRHNEEDDTYELRKWDSFGGKSRLEDTFETEEDAELARYESWKLASFESNSNAPMFEESYEQAIEAMAEAKGCTPAVIRRYLAFQAIADERNRLHRIAIDEQYQRLRELIQQEADEITPDAQLLEEVRAARRINSNEEKTKALAVAQVAFLHRIGHYPIRTDFWKVFKIVNKKPLQYEPL